MLCGCKKETSDALKFKDEFESLNKSHSVVNVNEKNPFIYKTTEEIQELINNEETFVVFYGSSKDENARILVEPIIDYSSKYSLSKVYYVSGPVNVVGYSKGNIKGESTDSSEVENIINEIATELNTCDINVGC